MTTRSYSDVWVCVDCYLAHHYGATEVDGQWFAGENDSPCESVLATASLSGQRIPNP